jgi:small subunit ribosomal protein S3
MMVVKRIFLDESAQEAEIRAWLRKKFERAGYSHCQIQRTPLGTRIVVWAERPGVVIGKSGKRVDEITEEIKQLFKLENPMVDVKEVKNPYLDAHIVADKVARAIERGIHFKRVGNFYVDRVMEAGARGVEIKIAGKLAGVARSRFQKFKRGYVARSGDVRERFVEHAYAQAMIKPGIVGVEVRIMKELPEEVVEKA